METNDIVLLAVTLVILGEVTYLLTKLPKTSIKSKDRAILIDTSVLMDGRITSIAATGFMGGTLVVPRSVIGELQLLADGSDSDKRARARYGLDVVAELQNMDNVDVEILQDGSRANEGVDERLLTLAKRHGALICTLDFNLNKVAAVEGIHVLNINELAQGLRMSHLPGDQIVLELVQKGQDAHQGVGYLPDGTMVVVEQASAYIGKSVNAEVIRSLQTAAGKMMFAKRLGEHHDKPQLPHKPVGHSGSGRKKAAVKQQPEPTQTPAKQRASTPRQERVPQPPATRSTAPKRQSQSVKRPHTSSSQLKPSGRRRSRRPDHEADLIALVDSQE